jgi:hypothetical protein
MPGTAHDPLNVRSMRTILVFDESVSSAVRDGAREARQGSNFKGMDATSQIASKQSSIKPRV